MPAIVDTIRRVIRRPRVLRLRTSGSFRIVRSDAELERTAALLAYYGKQSAAVICNHLLTLWQLDTTALYVQIDGAPANVNVVVTPHGGHRIVAAAQHFRIETETEEPAPDGSYLTPREYRRLGLYERPPTERAVVALRIDAGSGSTYLVDVPRYVRRATIVVNGRLVTSRVQIPEAGDLRYGTAGHARLTR